MSRLPDAIDLLQAARQTVLDELVPALPASLRYQALMVANALAIASRESRDRGPPPDLEQEGRLARAIRAGALDDDAATFDALHRLVEHKLSVFNPKLLCLAGVPHSDPPSNPPTETGTS